MSTLDHPRFLLPAAVLAVAGLFCSLPPAATETATSACVAETEHFRFYSDPWVNLHHVLYFQAVTEEEAAAAARATGSGERHRPRRLGDGPDDLGLLDDLPEAERKTWRRALDLYRAELAERDLLMGRDMVELRNALARGGPTAVRAGMKLPAGEPGALGSLPTELAATLESAMAIYRPHLWPAHDRRNRRWVADVQPRLKRLAPAVAPRLARAFGGAWPETGLRIDVSIHAGWAGAYSSWHPDHIVISSTDPSHAADPEAPEAEGEGYLAVESLFHESGHSRALGAELNGLIERAFAAHGAEAPRGLWHGLLFYTSGELTRSAMEAAGEPGYVGYAERFGLVDRSSGWREWYRALDTHWRPFLAGTTAPAEAREEALRAAAAEMSGPNEPRAAEE